MAEEAQVIAEKLWKTILLIGDVLVSEDTNIDEEPGINFLLQKKLIKVSDFRGQRRLSPEWPYWTLSLDERKTILKLGLVGNTPVNIVKTLVPEAKQLGVLFPLRETKHLMELGLVELTEDKKSLQIVF